jgi:hypothetical protein
MQGLEPGDDIVCIGPHCWLSRSFHWRVGFFFETERPASELSEAGERTTLYIPLGVKRPKPGNSWRT